MEQNIETYLEKQLDRTNSWLSFAEAKNAGLIAANIAMLATVIVLFHEAPVFCVTSGIIILMSCVLCLISFIPNLSNTVIKKKKPTYNSEKDYNLIFYKEIAEIGDVETYIKLINNKYYKNEATISNQAEDLALEVMVNSQITMNKYMWFGYAVKVDLVAIICIISLFIAA